MILLPIIKSIITSKFAFDVTFKKFGENKIRFLCKRKSRHFRAAKWKSFQNRTESKKRVKVVDLECQFEGFMYPNLILPIYKVKN